MGFNLFKYYRRSPIVNLLIMILQLIDHIDKTVTLYLHFNFSFNNRSSYFVCVYVQFMRFNPLFIRKRSLNLLNFPTSCFALCKKKQRTAKTTKHKLCPSEDH